MTSRSRLGFLKNNQKGIESMQFKEITKDDPMIIKFTVEYRCADLPYNPEKIREAIDNALEPIRKHFIARGMENRHALITNKLWEEK